MDAADGAVLWSFEVTVPVLSLRGLAEPLLAGTRVFAGTGSGRVMK